MRLRWTPRSHPSRTGCTRSACSHTRCNQSEQRPPKQTMIAQWERGCHTSGSHTILVGARAGQPCLHASGSIESIGWASECGRPSPIIAVNVGIHARRTSQRASNRPECAVSCRLTGGLTCRLAIARLRHAGIERSCGGTRVVGPGATFVSIASRLGHVGL